MNAHHISGELGVLIEELDAGVAFVLREHGSRLAAHLDRQLGPIESLIDELFFDERCDERSMRRVREAMDGLRATCLYLPAELECAVDRSAYDRLRALRIDLDLDLLAGPCTPDS